MASTQHIKEGQRIIIITTNESGNVLGQVGGIIQVRRGPKLFTNVAFIDSGNCTINLPTIDTFQPRLVLPTERSTADHRIDHYMVQKV